MRLVVSDTGPVNYLILIEHIEILPGLFEKVIIPDVVFRELTHPNAPDVVRGWIQDPPSWLEVREPLPETDLDSPVRSLDAGERAAILLARELGADLLLMDDREGVAAAQSMGLAVTGTIGLLYLAARRGLLDLSEAFERLRHTSFRCPDRIMVELLNRFERERE